MLELLIQKNINFIKKHSVCDDKQVAIYKYGLQILYTYIIDIGILFSLACLCDKLAETIFMTIFFACLQVFGGGYHAQTQIKCLNIMICGWGVAMLLLEYLYVDVIYLVFFSIVAYIVICHIAPICNVNHPITIKVYKKSKQIIKAIASIILLCIIISALLKKEYYCKIFVVTLLQYLVSLLCAYIFQKIRKI